MLCILLTCITSVKNYFILKRLCLFIFQVALSYKNQILGYIDSYIARTRYLVNSILSKFYHKHFTISQTQCKDEASQIYRKLQNVLPSLNRITAQENVLSDRNNDKLAELVFWIIFLLINILTY